MSKTSHERHLLRARRTWPLAIASLSAVAFLAACGSGATSTAGSTTSPSSAPVVAPAATPSLSCAQVRGLRAALTNFGSIRVNTNTGRQISADVTEVAIALTAMKGELSSAFAAEAHQIGADLTTIGEHARALSAHPSPANLRATTTAVSQLKTAAALAIAMMRTACPSSS
jgi:hypothetical protein